MDQTATTRQPDTGTEAANTWQLRLYVAGHTAKSVIAMANLTRICEDNLEGRYSIKVIDLTVCPQLAKGDQILALPTLVRQLPEPVKQILGDLSDTERVLVGLDIKLLNELGWPVGS